MADVRNDPSMEDILASIKRIIADDTATAMDAPRPRGRSAHPAAARTVTTTPAAPAAAEVLELTEELPDAGTDADEPIIDRPKAWPAFTVAEPPHTAIDMAIEADTEADTVEPELISTATAEASRQAFASLASRVVKPAPGDDQTLEGLVREMLRPMLKEWLDARLPELVEGVVQREIARIAGRTL